MMEISGIKTFLALNQMFFVLEQTFVKLAKTFITNYNEMHRKEDDPKKLKWVNMAE
jgi:hypothetical protein